MNKSISPVLTVLQAVSFLFISSFCSASDLQREKRLADEIIDSIIDGDAIYLKTDNHSFLSIFTEAEEPTGDQKNHAVIVLHGRGQHPDWPETTNPLRVGLASKGFTTLSIQMPVLPTIASYEDYAEIMHEGGPRIEAGLDYLEQRGYEHIHIVAHSCSTQMVSRWIANGGGHDVSSYAFLGLVTENYLEAFGSLPPLQDIPQPVLDIYGEWDSVKYHAPARLLTIELGANPHSRQQMISRADHMFRGRGEVLTNEVFKWLNHLTDIKSTEN